MSEFDLKTNKKIKNKIMKKGVMDDQRDILLQYYY